MTIFIYRPTHQPGDDALYTVGHYDPEGRFIPSSDHPDEQEARSVTAWLNGANGDDPRKRRETQAEVPFNQYSDVERNVYEGWKDIESLAHTTARNAGWYHDPKTGEPITRNTGEVLMLMVSELAEALEADRKDLMDDKLPHRTGMAVELADCIIRIADTAAALNLDVAQAIVEKNRFNERRSDHKLENRAAGGKKY